MEYYLTIDLLYLNEWKEKNIDPADCFIFSFIKKCQGGKYSGLCYDDDYVWLKHQKILDEIPLLDISLETLRKRLTKLVKANLVDVKYKKYEGFRKKAFFKVSDAFWKIEDWYRKEADIKSKYKGKERIDILSKHFELKPSINYRKKPKLNNIKRDLNGKFIKSPIGKKRPMGKKPTIGQILPMPNGQKRPMAIGQIRPLDQCISIIDTNINNKDYYLSLIKELNKKHKLMLCKNNKVFDNFDSLKTKELLDIEYLSFVAEKYENIKLEIRAGKFILALENELFEDEWKGQGEHYNKIEHNNSKAKKERETVEKYISGLPNDELDRYKKIALKNVPEETKNDYISKSVEMKYKLSKMRLNAEVFNLVKNDMLERV